MTAQPRQMEDDPGTVDFILDCIKGDRFKDTMGMTAEAYVRYSLGQSAHLYHAEGFADVAMERDMQEAYAKRLTNAARMLVRILDDGNYTVPMGAFTHLKAVLRGE